MKRNIVGLLLFLILITSSGLLFSCGGETLPKPKAMLRLTYPIEVYQEVTTDCPYIFEKNELASLVRSKRGNFCEFNLEYPTLKATIYISYRRINNDLRKLLRDAQNITQEHVIKADEIIYEEYTNPDKKVYGMFYKVAGNAASQSQFYITDSIRHFITGSIYFKAKPNYDSILPGAHYLRNDMQHLMETVEWSTTD